MWDSQYADGEDERDDLIQCVTGLADAGVPVSLRPGATLSSGGGDRDGALPREMGGDRCGATQSRLDELCRRTADVCGHVSIVHARPEYLRRSGEAACTIGRTAVGTLRVSGETASAVAALDEIWVPSAFSRMALAASGVPEEKIRIVPSAVDELYLVDRDRQAVEMGERFVFTTVLDWDYLRGLDIVLEAYVREFNRSDDVALLLRAPQRPRAAAAVKGGEGSTLLEEMGSWLFECVRGRGGESEDRKRFDRALSAIADDKLREHLIRERRTEIETANEIRTAVREEMRSREDDIPEIRVAGGVLPRYLIPRLYAACDAFVMAPRAERWGRPFLEAMASGLPTIGTRWGGHLDFMRPDNSFLVRVRALVDIRDNDRLQRGDQRLAEPDVEHLRELMRRVFEYRSEAKERAMRGAVHVRTKNSRARAGGLMAERLADLGGDLALEVAEAA